ncbi:MAG: T9SS type A sorting domain-containing protein [Ignavibacteriales bacterium]|nr:T9SS type A sorting domain-containing protein [Ignavibacteriales bacterium]
MKKFRYISLVILIAAGNVFSQGWKTGGSMPIPVSGGKAFVKDSLIYLLGGWSDQLLSYTNLIQSYNPSDGSWRIIDTMKFARSGFIADIYNGNLVYSGGNIPDFGFHNALEVYDFHNKPFVHSSHTIFRRAYAAGEIIDSNLFVFGGYTLEPAQPVVFKYNIPQGKMESSLDTSISPTDFPIDQMIARFDDNLYLFGGSIHTISSLIFKYSTSIGSYIPIDSRLESARAGGSTVKPGENIIMLIGGYNEVNNALSSTEIVIKTGEQFTGASGPALNIGRNDASAVIFGDSIYVFGGTGSSGFNIATIEVLPVHGITAIKETGETLPQDFSLSQNYPNPFNSSTVIRFSLKSDAEVELNIFSSDGSLVKSLLKQSFSPGNYSVQWDGDDSYSRPVSSGVYFVTLSNGKDRVTKKMALMK